MTKQRHGNGATQSQTPAWWGVTQHEGKSHEIVGNDWLFFPTATAVLFACVTARGCALAATHWIALEVKFVAVFNYVAQIMSPTNKQRGN